MRLDLHKRTPYEMPRLIFGTWKGANDVLRNIQYNIDVYGCVSVADMLDAAGEDSNYIDNKYGWIDLHGAFVGPDRTSTGYEIRLPKPYLLGSDESTNNSKKEKELMRDPFTMANICSKNPDVYMTIDGETFPVKIKNVTCNSADRFASSTTLTVEIPGYCTPIVTSNKRVRSREYNITRVIFNDPATIVFWSDGTKTVVKCDKRDKFDPEKGLAMAIAKKSLGNKYEYYEVFEKFIPCTYLEQEKTVKDAFAEMMMNEAMTVAEKLREAASKPCGDKDRTCWKCDYYDVASDMYPCSNCLDASVHGDHYVFWTRKED